MNRRSGLGVVLLASVAAGALSLSWRASVAAQTTAAPTPATLLSDVIPWSADPKRSDWGEERHAFTGETHGTKDLFVSSFVLKPGLAVHPPHRHSQEEFMTIEEGSGLWHLDGRDIPAAKGDVIYCAPWALHGLKNTGATPLVYFVVQFHSKGVAPAVRPQSAS